MARPNLFAHATSELSQDAVLCWLLGWADPAAAQEDEALHRLGRSFVELLCEKANASVPGPAEKVKVQRQVSLRVPGSGRRRSADILARVGETHRILIEDKAGTREHSNQLADYRAALANAEEGDRDDDGAFELVTVYVQTHEQSSYERVENADFCVVRRADLLRLFEDYHEGGGADRIALDFCDYLMELDRKIKAYEGCSLDEWHGRYTWQGFFTRLQDELGEGETRRGSWDYSNNPRGGHWSFWWAFQPVEDGELYLQLESASSEDVDHSRAAVRVRLSSKSSEKLASATGKKWHRALAEVCGSRDLDLRRPAAFRGGKTMKVGTLIPECRVTGGDGRLDWEGTVEKLRVAEDVLRAVAANATS